jgi:hypothetical protein
VKTIEVNLIGDLKQKGVSKKMGALPDKISPAGAKPEDARNNLILVATAGSAGFAIIIIILILIGSFVWGLTINSNIDKVEDGIEMNRSRLAKYTKVRKQLIKEQKSYELKANIKNYIEKQSLPLGEILEEMRAKIPENVYLTSIVKSKKGVLLKGNIPALTENPMKHLSMFIVNINTMKPDVSIVNKASLSSVTNKTGTYEFTISASFDNSRLKK